jgi:Protein of unknown function (DUF2815)
MAKVSTKKFDISTLKWSDGTAFSGNVADLIDESTAKGTFLNTYTIISGAGVVSFPSILKPSPKSKDSTEMRYKMDLVFDKESPTAKLCEALKNHMILRMFGVKNTAGQFVLPAKIASSITPDKLFLKDGNLNVAKGKLEPYAGYADKVYITATSLTAVGILAPDGVTKLDKDTDFYAGCLSKISFGLSCYDFKGGQGVKANLFGVKKTADGERIGGGGEVAVEDSGLGEPEPEQTIPAFLAGATA